MNYLAQQLQPSRLTALPGRFYEVTQTEQFPQATFAHINGHLLEQLGIDRQAFATDDNIPFLTAKHPFTPHQPISTVYAGHQFGIYTSRLGDGRVYILGDITARDGACWEIQLKGAGPTPYARGNSGRMTMAEAITEYLGCEAIAGLGIAGTRGLALISNTQNATSKDAPESIFIRTAHSHLRFGHFEYLHNQGDVPLLKELADFVIEHHYPELLNYDDTTRYLQLLLTVTHRTAQLVAHWQSVGFVHSVMNTDNMSILGITLDYGMYGFMETYDPAYSPNENDDQDRYAFDQQIDVARWNCLALAEALIELLPGKRIPAALLKHYRTAYSESYHALMRTKLGLSDSYPEDIALISNLLHLLQQYRVDYTRFFRGLRFFATENFTKDNMEATVEMNRGKNRKNEQHGENWQTALSVWLDSYRQRLNLETTSAEQCEKKMLAHNPKYILRQHSLENAIRQAEQALNFSPLNELLLVLQSPCLEHEGFEHLA